MTELSIIASNKQLLTQLANPDLLVVDLRPAEVYQAGHIPGAINFSIADIVLDIPPVAAALPSLEELETSLSRVGISDGTHVVAYDQYSFGPPCRLLWTLSVVGHKKWSLLEGGFEKWARDDFPIEQNAQRRAGGELSVHFDSSVFADKAYILSNLNNADCVVWDVRTEEEYSGADCRALRCGHIPGAINLPWTFAINAHDGHTICDSALIARQLARLGITPDREIIVHCQSHTRSSHTFVLLKQLGFPRVRGYAGSWSEWGNDANTPIESGSFSH